MTGSRNVWLPHLVLILGVVIFAFPIYLAVIGSTHSAPTIARGQMPLTPGPQAVENYTQALQTGEGARVRGTPALIMMRNSLIMAMVIVVGKIAISLLSAFAVVFFQFPLRMTFFWMIFITLMLPVEVRIIPTYAVVANFGMIDTFAGLTIPLIASATATLLFRQFFMTIPDELVDASQIDGARGRETIVIGIVKMIGTGEAQTDWNIIMATAVLALLPPVLVVIAMQRWFVKGLVDAEK